MKCTLLLALLLVVSACDKKAAQPPTPEVVKPAGPITEERLGVKFFPGAKLVTSGETDEVLSANLRTTEPAAAVTKFYEGELGMPVSGKGAGMITGKKGKIQYAVSVVAEGETTSVSILGKK